MVIVEKQEGSSFVIGEVSESPNLGKISKRKKSDAEKKIKSFDYDLLLRKPYWNEEETSFITGKAVSTLRNDRHLRRGIPYLKLGKRSIRYKREDGLAYMEAHRISFDGAAE